MKLLQEKKFFEVLQNLTSVSNDKINLKNTKTNVKAIKRKSEILNKLDNLFSDENLQKLKENYLNELKIDAEKLQQNQSDLNDIIQEKFFGRSDIDEQKWMDLNIEKYSYVTKYFEAIKKTIKSQQKILISEDLDLKVRRNADLRLQNELDNKNWTSFTELASDIFNSKEVVDIIKSKTNEKVRKSNKPLSILLIDCFLEEVSETFAKSVETKDFSGMRTIADLAIKINQNWNTSLYKIYNNSFDKSSQIFYSNQYWRDYDKKPLKNQIHARLTKLLTEMEKIIIPFDENTQTSNLEIFELKEKLIEDNFNPESEKKLINKILGYNPIPLIRTCKRKNLFGIIDYLDQDFKLTHKHIFSYSPITLLKELKPYIMMILEDQALDKTSKYEQIIILISFFYKDVLKYKKSMKNALKQDLFQKNYWSQTFPGDDNNLVVNKWFEQFIIQETESLNINFNKKMILPNWFYWIYLNAEDLFYNGEFWLKPSTFENLFNLQIELNQKYLNDIYSTEFYDFSILEKDTINPDIDFIKNNWNKVKDFLQETDKEIKEQEEKLLN